MSLGRSPLTIDARSRRVSVPKGALASSPQRRNVSRLKRKREMNGSKVMQKWRKEKVRRELLSLFLSSALFRSCRSHVIDFQPSFTTTYQIRRDETSLNLLTDEEHPRMMSGFASRWLIWGNPQEFRICSCRHSCKYHLMQA